MPSFREVRSLMLSLEPPSQVAPAPAVVDELLPDLTANYVSASGSHSVLYSLHVLLAPSATNGSKPEVLARRVAEKLQADGFHRIKPRPADRPEWDSFTHSKSAWRATTIQRDRSFLDIDFFRGPEQIGTVYPVIPDKEIIRDESGVTLTAPKDEL